MNPFKIARELKALGIKIREVHEETEDCDAEIEISRTISVQIGHSYMIVNRAEGEGDAFCMHHSPARRIVAEVAADLVIAQAAE